MTVSGSGAASTVTAVGDSNDPGLYDNTRGRWCPSQQPTGMAKTLVSGGTFSITVAPASGPCAGQLPAGPYTIGLRNGPVFTGSPGSYAWGGLTHCTAQEPPLVYNLGSVNVDSAGNAQVTVNVPTGLTPNGPNDFSSLCLWRFTPGDEDDTTNGIEAPVRVGGVIYGDGLTAQALQGGGSPSVLSPRCFDACPVTVPFGEFWHTFNDFSIPGRGIALSLDRTYSTNDRLVDGPFGFGWTSSYNASLSAIGGSVTVREENGARVTFAQAGSTYSAPAWVQATLSFDVPSQTWTFKRRGVITMTFNAQGRLTQIQDRNAYKTKLTYDAQGQLSTVEDPSLRKLTFTWLNGRVDRVTDQATPVRTVTYG